MKKWQLPLLFIPFKVLCILVFEPDPALSVVCNAGIIPYGIPWIAINGIVCVNRTLWAWYILPIDVILSCLLYAKVQTQQAIIFTAYNLWLWVDEYSNLSVMWFTQFGSLSPIFIILSILTKIPLPFQTASWNYAFGSTWRYFSLPRMISYTLILSSWLYAFYGWLSFRIHRKNK